MAGRGSSRALSRLVRLAGPIVASCVLQSVVKMVSVMVVGHLGELPLAGASLASVTGYSLLVRNDTLSSRPPHKSQSSFSNPLLIITAFFLISTLRWLPVKTQSGMATALDTLCGQAYGARQHHLLCVYKQRAMVVLGLACVPVALVWARAGDILASLGQDPAIAAEAGAYARWLIPSLLAYVPLQCHVRFLQAQGVVLPVTATSGATALCHLAVCWALVHKAGMGRRAQQRRLVRRQPRHAGALRQAVRRLQGHVERLLQGRPHGARPLHAARRAVCDDDMVTRKLLFTPSHKNIFV
jgi:multidrug resistance protein, MATE family